MQLCSCGFHKKQNLCLNSLNWMDVTTVQKFVHWAGVSGREGVSLRPFACWYCRFEFRQSRACLSLVRVGCCQVDISASGWSLVQRSPTDRVCVCVCARARDLVCFCIFFFYVIYWACSTAHSSIAHAGSDGTRRRTGGEVKGKDANGVGSQ